VQTHHYILTTYYHLTPNKPPEKGGFFLSIEKEENFMFKKILIVLAMTTLMASTASAATSYGIAPAGMDGAQAKLMARRAAIVDMQRQTNGKAMPILSEKWDGRIYEIEF
jgi:hypothetical protein